VAATLAESLAAGDPEAFAALYDRLALRLLGAARTMTGSAAEAEDVLQDLFVELTRGMPDLLERRHEAWRLRTLLTGDL
jgi:DNA-directed RNA polymerase specialized sigma24 family protein